MAQGALTTVESERNGRLRSKWIAGVWQSGAIVVAAVGIGILVNAVRPDRIPLVGDWSTRGRLSSVMTVEDPVVSLEEASALYAAQGALFIDARPEEAYREGHIAGALSLPWEEFENRFDGAMAEAPPDSLIIVYCDGEECSLSLDLAAALVGKGYAHVRVLENGWTLWRGAKLPVE